MTAEISPAARALLVLEVIQNTPGITAQRLGDRLGITDRAARRYVHILREADLPIESVSGPHGGYRVGRGLRLPPLMFTPAEAMGLLMAVLEGHPGAAAPDDPVGSALAKILRVVPARLAGPLALSRPAGSPGSPGPAAVSPELTSELIGACTSSQRLRLQYRLAPERVTHMDVDPWAVVLRHSRWYLLGWSHSRQAQRVLRIDRIAAVSRLPDTFTPPANLDALRTLEEHLHQGWTHQVEVLIEACSADVRRWLPRSLGTIEPVDDERCRLLATTDNLEWYARQLALIPVAFEVTGSAALREAMARLSERLARAGGRD